MKLRLFINLLVCAGLFHVAGASAAPTKADLDKAANKMCAAIQQCARQEMARGMGGNDIPPALQQQLESTINSMCKNFSSRYDYGIFEKHQNLVGMAIQCMNTMSSSSCEEFEKVAETGVCKQLNEKLEAIE